MRAFLRTKGIALSTGTISNRRLDFLLLFKQLHEAKTAEITALIDRNGGMILHMDGTHRSGGRMDKPPNIVYCPILAILSNLWNPTYQKEILRDVVDLGYSLSPFVNDLPKHRKEYRETRKNKL